MRKFIILFRLKLKKKGYRYTILNIIPIIIVIGFMITFYDFYTLSDTSMNKTYALGTTIVSGIDRGDAVLFSQDENIQIRRVIGLPGDIIHIDGQNIYINNQKCDESDYLNEKTYSLDYEYTVPENTVFVLSDNRNYEDSRIYGVISIEQIKQKIIGLF